MVAVSLCAAFSGLTGFGLSLVYPALGVEAIARSLRRRTKSAWLLTSSHASG